MARDGRLWFPTIRGAVVYDPKDSEEHAAPSAPAVLFEELRVDSQPVPRPNGRASPWARAAWRSRYSAPSLLTPQRLRFRFRLEGVDADWVSDGRERMAHYTHLAPGSYRFRVQVESADGEARPPRRR